MCGKFPPENLNPDLYPRTPQALILMLFTFRYIYIYIVNLKILIIEFHVLYVFNMHIKFYSNKMLFIIRSINLFFFIHNFRSQKPDILIFYFIEIL